MEDENSRLREALWEEWRLNHSEHCTDEWPHLDGRLCCHPLPSVLRVTLANGASRLRLGAGERFG